MKIQYKILFKNVVEHACFVKIGSITAVIYWRVDTDLCPYSPYCLTDLGTILNRRFLCNTVLGEFRENRYSERHPLQTDVHEVLPYFLHFSFDLDEVGSKNYFSSCEFYVNRRSVLAGVNQFRIYQYFPNVLFNLGGNRCEISYV